VDLTRSQGRDANGRVSKEDVEAYASARSGAPDGGGGGPGQSAAPDIGAPPAARVPSHPRTA